MDEAILASTLAAVIALGSGALIPWLVMRAVMAGPAADVTTATNHRGVAIGPVLGLVWPLWAVSLLGAQAVLDVAVTLSPGDSAGWAMVERVAGTPLSLPLFALPFLLVTGVYALGLADDVFGRGGPKGFRGHLGALKRGQVTTGLLKLAGIGAVALLYGAAAARGVVERGAGEQPSGPWTFLGAWLLAAGVIALSANLLNLLDLRPGRALKSYAVLVVPPVAAFALAAVESYNASVAPLAGEMSGLALAPWEGGVVAALAVLVTLAPVVAVWRYDLGERAMLGDGGANAMGAIVGYLLTAVLPVTGLAIAFVVLLVLNLLSERVSFSAVIERVAPLRWLDALGRLPAATPGGRVRADDAAQAPSVRYDASGTVSEGED